MPSSDQGDRRASRPRKKAKVLPSPTPAQNRKAFAEIRRNVAKQQAAKAAVRPNPDQQAGVSKGPTVKQTRVTVRKLAQQQDRKQAVAHRTDRTEARSRPVAPALAKLPIKTIYVTDLKHPNAKPVVHVYRYDKTRKQPMITTGEARQMAGIDLAKRVAPAVKILNETLRPVHGVAATSDALVRGKSVGKALGQGATAVKQNKGPLFSDVLKHAGAPKILRAPLGFTLDVALDPTTYLTGGTAAVGRKALAKELARVAAKADRAGMSESGKIAVLRAAGKKAATDERRGVTIKFAGREVPGVTRATAAVAGGVKKGAARAPKNVKAVAGTARDAVREFHPQLKPAGADRAEFENARQASRSARAADNQAGAKAQREAVALRKAIGAAQYGDVIHAIETGKIGNLPEHLRQPAQFLRSSLRHAERTRRQAGVNQGHIPNYYPHARVQEVEEGKQILDTARSGGANVRDVGSRKGRTIRGTVRGINADPKRTGTFSEDIPSIHVNYNADTAHIVNQTTFLRRLADAGRPLRSMPDKADVVLRFATKDGRLGVTQASRKDIEDELERGVLRQQGRMRKLRPQELHFLRQGGSGRYVVMNAETAKEAMRGAQRGVAGTTTGRLVDKTTGGFKRLATATPGFHVRNAIGDAQMAVLSQPAHKLPGNTRAAAKALKAISQDERAPLRRGSAAAGKTIKIGGKDQPLGEFLDGAQKHGVIRSGFIGRELEDMTSSSVRTAKLRTAKRGVGTGVKRAMQNREDLFRLATYKHQLDKGLSQAAAADKALETHIDYGDLSELERKFLRRAVPFYTFSARAIPFHAKKLVTNPGKFAAYAKLREETARAVGYTDAEEADKDLPEYQQRQAPIFIKIGGKRLAVSGALPLATSLDELPVGLNPLKYGAELRDFAVGQTNPLIQKPFELSANRSFYSRRDIQDPNSPLVAAPSWVKGLPKGTRDRLGIVDDYIDKRTGKRVAAWPGKVDYAFKSLPGPVYLANQLATSGTSRTGQGQTSKIVTGLVGVKASPIDPVGTAIGLLYDRKNKLSEKQKADGQRGIRSGKEHQARAIELAQINQKLAVLTSKRGDKVPYGRSRSSVATPAAKKKAAQPDEFDDAFNTLDPNVDTSGVGDDVFDDLDGIG